MSSTDTDDDSTAISHQAIIVICLVGAGVLLLCAWAVGRHFYNRDDPAPLVDQQGQDGLSQAQYMRLVRLRNHDNLQAQHGYAGRPKPVTYSSYVSEV